MIKLLKKAVSYIMLMSLASCSIGAEYKFIDNFPVPDNAFDISKTKFDRGNAQQLLFKLDEAYPSENSLDVYREELKKNSWTLCRDSKQGWSTHEDRTTSPYLLVHQFIEHWVLPSENKLIILSATYYSEDLSSRGPDNDVQHFIVFVQQISDLKKNLFELGVKCD